MHAAAGSSANWVQTRPSHRSVSQHLRSAPGALRGGSSRMAVRSQVQQTNSWLHICTQLDCNCNLLASQFISRPTYKGVHLGRPLRLGGTRHPSCLFAWVSASLGQLVTGTGRKDRSSEPALADPTSPQLCHPCLWRLAPAVLA